MKIYRITNLINNKVYIGKSKDPEKRWKDHLSFAKGGSDLLLHRAIRKYGEDSFKLEVILECEGTGTEEEKQMILEHDCCILDGVDKGYNMTRGGDGFDSETTSFYLLRASENGTNHFLKGNKGYIASIEKQKQLVEEGKHIFQSEEHRAKIRELQKRRIAEGVHPLAGERGSKQSSELQRKRIAEGTFHCHKPEMKAHLSAKQKELIASGKHNSVQELTCPHCGATGKGAIMKRWHMDNCNKNPDREPQDRTSKLPVYNNGKVNRRFSKDPGAPWVLGRLEQKLKSTLSREEALLKAIKGSTTWNDGEKNYRLPAGEKPEPHWKRGLLRKPKQ